MHVLIVESESTTAGPVRDGVIGAGMTAELVIGASRPSGKLPRPPTTWSSSA